MAHHEAVIRDTMSDITEDYDLRINGGSHDLFGAGDHLHHDPSHGQARNNAGERAPLPQAQHQTSSNFDSPPPSRRTRTLHNSHDAVNDSLPPHQATFLSPFSSKAVATRSANDNQDDIFQLSLHATKPVSIVVYVTNPAKNTGERIPCVFPPLVALEGKLSNDDASTSTTSLPGAAGANNPPSPTTATLTAAMQTKDLVIINPTAFGTALPNQLSLDILNSITRVVQISSEDWVRLYRFHQVWWPRGMHQGLDRLATAMAHDVTQAGSIAQRVVIRMGSSSSHNMDTATSPPTNPLWGSVVHATVAQAFAQTVGTSRQEILETFGLLGWTLHQMGPRLPPTAQLTLSVLQVLPTEQGREELQDLLKTKSNLKPVALQHVNGSLTVTRWTQVPIDATNLKAVGHLMRRAWMACTHPRRNRHRGHVVATLRVYPHASQALATTTDAQQLLHSAAITLVDLAPLVPGPTETIKRDATIRQTISVLGGVLRGTLLKAAGNHVAIPFRESLLTKVLQGFMDRPDSRTLLLSGVSPLKDDYDRSMADLRYCSRILEKPGEAPKSPFDALSKGTSPTSQMSHSTSASEQRQRQIMLEQFDKKYHMDLLRNVTADPRQRFNRAGIRPARQRVALASSDDQVETYIPPDYMDIDPGAVPLRPIHDAIPPHVGSGLSETAEETEARPHALDTTFSLDSMERGSMETDPGYAYQDNEALQADFMEPSPLAASIGSNEFAAAPVFQHEPTPSEENNQRLDQQPNRTTEHELMGEQSISVGDDQSSRNAEMDALSLELRQGDVARRDSASPSDSAMDNLSYELLHGQNQTEQALGNLKESPIEIVNPSTADDAVEPVEWTRSSLPSKDGGITPSNGAVHAQVNYSQHREPALSKYHERTAFEDELQHTTASLYDPPSRYHYTAPRTQFDPYNPPLFSSKPNAGHVDLTLYQMTPRGASGLPPDIVVNGDGPSYGDLKRPNGSRNKQTAMNGEESSEYDEAHFDTMQLKELQSLDSTTYSNLQLSLSGHGNLPVSQESGMRQIYADPPLRRSVPDPPSQDSMQETLWQNNLQSSSPLPSDTEIPPPQNWDEEENAQNTKTPTAHSVEGRRALNAGIDEEAFPTGHLPDEDLLSNEEVTNDHPISQNERPASPDSLPSHGSQTEVEIGKIDLLLNEVRNKTKSRSVSISNDLNLIEQNQRTVVRRLVVERDDARRDLDFRTEEQRKESMRREQELRELRKSLESAHSERQELEQIAEEAVTGREGLERRALELERALKKKEEESVSRSEYLLQRDELENVKQNLLERTELLKKVQAEVSEQMGIISKKTIELQDLEQEKVDLTSRLQNEKSMIGKFEERNGKVQAELDSLRSQLIILENERNLLQSQMDSTKRSLQLSLEQKDGFAKNLSEQLEQLHVELHESQRALWEKQEIVTKLEKESSKHSLETEKLSERIKELEEEVEELRRAKDELAMELSSKLKDTKELSEALRAVAKERDDAEQKMEEAERLREDAEALMKRVEQETASFRDEAERRLQTFFKRHQEHEELMKNQEADMKSLGDEKEELRRELERAKKENESTSLRANELRVQLEEITSSRTTLSDHEQAELSRLRSSKSELETELYGLREKISDMERQYRVKAENERIARLRADEERDAAQRVELENAERRLIEAERNARREMEEEFEKFRVESDRHTRLQLDEARKRALEEGEQKARREIEETQGKIEVNAERKMRRELEKEKEKLQQESDQALRKRLEIELEKIQLQAEGDIRNQVDAELERLRVKADNEMQAKLNEERDALRREVEVASQKRLDEETRQIQLAAEEKIREQIKELSERLRLESEEALLNALKDESDRLRLEAEEEVNSRVEAEHQRLMAAAERETQQEVQNQIERLRIQEEMKAKKQVEDELEAVRQEAQETASRQAEIEIERMRLEFEIDAGRKVEEERTRLQKEAEQSAQLLVERQTEGLRVESERHVRRQLDEEREKLRIEAAEAVQRQVDEEREKIRLEADRKVKDEAELVAARRLEDERERLRVEARRQINEELERLRIGLEREARDEAERLAMRRVEEERQLLLSEARLSVRRQVEEESERLRLQADREARSEAGRLAARQIEEERERLRVEAEREILRLQDERDARRLVKEERDRRRANAEREARRRGEEERSSRRWGETDLGTKLDMSRRLRLESEGAEQTRDRLNGHDSNHMGYRTRDEYDTPRMRLDLGQRRRENAIHGQDDYRRLEEVTVALAHALHGQARTDEEDIAHLLRQFHAAEDAIVAHSRYFRTRIEGLRHSVSKRLPPH